MPYNKRRHTNTVTIQLDSDDILTDTFLEIEECANFILETIETQRQKGDGIGPAMVNDLAQAIRYQLHAVVALLEGDRYEVIVKKCKPQPTPRNARVL